MQQKQMSHTGCQPESRAHYAHLDNIWHDWTYPPQQQSPIFFRQWFNYKCIIARSFNFIKTI